MFKIFGQKRQKQKILAGFVYYFRVIQAVQKWLKSTARPPVGTYLKLSPYSIFFDQRGSFSFDTTKTVEMIICSPNKLKEALADLGSPTDSHNWLGLLATEEVVVYEQNPHTLNTQSQELPLRFGISDLEKRKVSGWVRKVISATLKKENLPEINETGRLATQPATVDVALWLKGELRGSQIVSGKTFYEAVTKAALRAVFDHRFKPIALADLAQLRIEVAYMDDLLLPLPQFSWLGTEVLSYSQLGYQLRTPRGLGWYVPAVFNILPLNTLAQIFSNLIRKINFSGDEKDCDLWVFSTQIWIEDNSLTGATFDEQGPLLVNNLTKISPSEIAEAAVAHIHYNQETDGNLLPRLHPDKKTPTNSVDFLRLANAIYALSEYEQRTKNEMVRRVLVTAYDYLQKYLFTYPSFSSYEKAMTLAYALRAMQHLGKHDDKKSARQELLVLLPKLSYEPILFSQISLTLLTAEGVGEAECFSAYELVARVEKDFREKIRTRETVSLALYPELITLLPKVPASYKDANWLSADEVLGWYLRQQRVDGSFPSTTKGNRFSYVRGTAKILECLPATHEKERALVWQWLSTMQYNQNNSYHLPLAEQSKFIGGFRHDVFDRSAWLDAASHVLVAFCQEK